MSMKLGLNFKFYLLFLFFIGYTFMILLFYPGTSWAEMSGDDILAKSDAIFESPSAIMDVTMATTNADNTTVSSQMLVYSKKDVVGKTGKKRTLIKYISPPEDRGTLFLSLGGADQIWMYLPKIQKTVQISGAMLKQSMMNTDFSYEDLMDRSKLSDGYSAQLIGIENVDNTDCYIMDLRAKKGSAHYRQIKLWVSRDRFVPLKEEFYAGGGNLIKTARQTNIVKIHGRWVPTTIIFQDLAQKSHQTVLTMTQIRFMAPISEQYFNVDYLAKIR